MTGVVMPRLSDTMEEGTVLRWIKHDGEHVRRGEDLVEIETDKAAMTYESDREGVLHTIAGEGDTLAVGELIARIGESDGEATVRDATQTAGADTDDSEQPVPVSAAEPTRSAAAQQARSHATYEESSSEQTTPARGARVKASPLARRIARETGVDLGALSGSGPGGRIVKADVEASVGPSPSAAASASAVAAETAPGETAASETAPVEAAADETAASASAVPDETAPTSAAPPSEDVISIKGKSITVELTRTQRTIARRMAESKATIPDFTLVADVDMERCVELRGELKRLSHVDAPTYNDMIVKACALALREHPRANGSYRDGHFELHSRVNVGVAVAVASEDPGGGALVVPTVLDADTKALGEIARETRALAERVRDGSVTPPELSGGTFTVSNLGMYGVTSFTAIVNPPQAAILAIGALAPRAVIRDGHLVARHTMSVTLACDHRILYGADAALFLARIRELLEEPAALTL